MIIVCQTGETVALKKVALRRLEDGIPNQALREIKALQEIEDNQHVSMRGCHVRVRGQRSASHSSSSSSSGGEAEGRLPSWYRICPGLWLHAVWPLWGHQELWATPDPGSGQRLHDDAAEGRGLPASQQHHAPGEFHSLTWWSSCRDTSDSLHLKVHCGIVTNYFSVPSCECWRLHIEQISKQNGGLWKHIFAAGWQAFSFQRHQLYSR